MGAHILLPRKTCFLNFGPTREGANESERERATKQKENEWPECRFERVTSKRGETINSKWACRRCAYECRRSTFRCWCLLVAFPLRVNVATSLIASHVSHGHSPRQSFRFSGRTVEHAAVASAMRAMLFIFFALSGFKQENVNGQKRKMMNSTETPFLSFLLLWFLFSVFLCTKCCCVAIGICLMWCQCECSVSYSCNDNK